MQLPVGLWDCTDYRVGGVAHESYCLQCRKWGERSIPTNAWVGYGKSGLLDNEIRLGLERRPRLLDLG